MLTKAYDILLDQVENNLRNQDFRMNLCTEILLRNKIVVKLLHPSLIKDSQTGEDIYPEWAQNDIDKEYVSAIALLLTFSMKQDKEQLELFKARGDSKYFKEIKDFGVRSYAIDFGTDVQNATKKCIEIIKDIFEADSVKNIRINTINLADNSVFSKKLITAPKKQSESVKIDGIATRVVSEEDKTEHIEATESPIVNEDAEVAKPVNDIGKKEYRIAMWILGIIVAILLVCLFEFINKKYKQDADEYQQSQETYVWDGDSRTDTISTISATNRDRIMGKSSVNQSKAHTQVPVPQTEVIGKWREANSGGNYTWILEKVKSSGKYQVTVTYPGGMSMVYKCTRKTVNRSNEYIFHDSDLGRNNGVFTLNRGETLYFIPDFDDGANAILLICPENVTRVYTNDIDNRYYELFSDLKAI